MEIVHHYQVQQDLFILYEISQIERKFEQANMSTKRKENIERDTDLEREREKQEKCRVPFTISLS